MKALVGRVPMDGHRHAWRIVGVKVGHRADHQCFDAHLSGELLKLLPRSRFAVSQRVLQPLSFGDTDRQHLETGNRLQCRVVLLGDQIRCRPLVRCFD